MFRIQFFVGLPYTQPRQQIAEAVTLHDDPDKALSEAHAKAEFIQTLLVQQATGRLNWQPPMESDSDYKDGKLTDAARQRLMDERLLELMGPHPLPSRKVKNQNLPVVELQLVSDDGQITLLDVPRQPVSPPTENGWHPSGDYQAHIQLRFGDQFIGIGELQFASTTASHALSMATERARQLVTELKKEPKLRFIHFKDIKIMVERINTQISLVEDQPDFDWRHMEFPAPHF